MKFSDIPKEAVQAIAFGLGAASIVGCGNRVKQDQGQVVELSKANLPAVPPEQKAPVTPVVPAKKTAPPVENKSNNVKKEFPVVAPVQPPIGQGAKGVEQQPKVVPPKNVQPAIQDQLDVVVNDRYFTPNEAKHFYKKIEDVKILRGDLEKKWVAFSSAYTLTPELNKKRMEIHAVLFKVGIPNGQPPSAFAKIQLNNAELFFGVYGSVITGKANTPAAPFDRSDPKVVRAHEAADWAMKCETQLTPLVGLMQALSTNPGLAKAGIKTAPITDESLVQMLKTSKNPQILKLGGSQITDNGLKQLGSFKSIQTLDLSDTNIGNKGLSQITGLKALQTLGISNTKITNEGLKLLPNNFQNLQFLSLGGENVDNESLRILEGMKTLKRVTLSGRNTVSDAGIRRLQSAVRGVQVVRPGATLLEVEDRKK